MTKAKVHLLIDGEFHSIHRVQHVPRIGDEIRISDDHFVTVERVVWCIDEQSIDGQRVNIGTATISRG